MLPARHVCALKGWRALGFARGPERGHGFVKSERKPFDFPQGFGPEFSRRAEGFGTTEISLMPDGGTLQVKTEWDGERIVIRVIDSGKGIAKEIEDQLFKPFVTTKGDGRAGVGLAICARTVAQHRGEIKVEEGAGSGATFRITLPAVKAD